MSQTWMFVMYQLVPRDRIELPSARCKHAALPLDERGIVKNPGANADILEWPIFGGLGHNTWSG
jgi:hypothetical protein